MYSAGMTMTATIIRGLQKFHFHGWSVFRSVKKIAPCHATCSPLSLVRLSNKDRERPRARTRTSVLVTDDNILSYHFHSIPLFARFVSPFCRSVSEDETSNKLRTNIVRVSRTRHLAKNIELKNSKSIYLFYSFNSWRSWTKKKSKNKTGKYSISRKHSRETISC